MTTSTARRPRSIDCPDCGARMSLVRCGVDGHLGQRRTRRQQIDGTVCTGYIYAHDATGGADCYD